MKIHQAFFGDKHGSHNLIVSSIENKTVIGHLKLNTDIPASITIRESYLSGFRVAEHYVLTRTMNDAGSERPGMGFSHCLIIPVATLTMLHNLQDVVRLFVSVPQKDMVQLSELELEFTVAGTIPVSKVYPDMIAKLSSNPGTVIYLGYQNFENDMITLWQIMSPEQRANFSFTISGSPNEIANEQFNLVHTPISLEARWSKFPVIKHTSIEPSTEASLKFLLEPTSPEAVGFQNFVRMNSICFEYLHQYPAIAKLFRLSKQAIATPETMLLKRVISAIVEIIPNPNYAEELKETILKLFIQNIRLTETSDILLLRNMFFTAFPDGQPQISALMSRWAEKFIYAQNSSFFPLGIKVLQEAYNKENPEWWKAPIVSRFNQVCSSHDRQTAKFIWSIWTAAPDLIPSTKTSVTIEAQLFAIRKLVGNKDFYHKLAAYSLAQQWYMMYAEAVSYEFEPQEAIRAQLRADKSQDLEKNLNIIRANISDVIFFEACIIVDHETVHKIAGKLLASDPSLFKNFDIRNLNWQKIWLEAYHISGNITTAGQPVIKEFQQLITMVREKMAYSKPLLKAIACHSGNLYFDDKRAQTWLLLDTDTRAIVLEQTCTYIAGRFKNAEWAGFETDIKEYFLQRTFLKKQVIDNSAISIMSKLGILETTGKISGEHIIEILRAVGNNIKLFEAEGLSATINKYLLKDALDYIYQNRRRYTLFPEIVDGCKHLLSKWERLCLKSSNNIVSIQDLYLQIDRQNLHSVFGILHNLGFDDPELNRLQKEYVAGVKGIEMIELCNRLKSYIHNKS